MRLRAFLALGPAGMVGAYSWSAAFAASGAIMACLVNGTLHLPAALILEGLVLNLIRVIEATQRVESLAGRIDQLTAALVAANVDVPPPFPKRGW